MKSFCGLSYCSYIMIWMCHTSLLCMDDETCLIMNLFWETKYYLQTIQWAFPFSLTYKLNSLNHYSSFLFFTICIICNSDGKTVGACLDRNGLRPARYWRTVDNVVYVASEVCLLTLSLRISVLSISLQAWNLRV